MSGDFDDEFGDGDFAEIPDDNVMGKSDNFNLEDDDEMEFVPKSTNQRPGTAVNAAPTSKMRRTPPKNAGNQGNFASKQELSDMPFDLGTPDTSARKNFGNLANNGNQMTDRDRADDALDKLDFGNPEDDDMNLEDFIKKGGTAKDLLNKKSPAPTPASKPQPTPAKPAASNQNKPEDPFKKKTDLTNPKPATQPDKPISTPSKPAQPKPVTPTPAAPIGGSTITASGLKDSLARQVGGATGEDALDKLDFGDPGNMDDNLDLALDNSGGAQPLKPSPEIKPKEPIPKTEPKDTAKDKLPSQLGNKKGEEALAELDFGGDDDFDKDFGNNNLGGGNGPGRARVELQRVLEPLLRGGDVVAGELDLTGEGREVIETYRLFAYDQGWRQRMRDAVRTGLTAEAAIERLGQGDEVGRGYTFVARPHAPRDRGNTIMELAGDLAAELIGQRRRPGRNQEPGGQVAALVVASQPLNSGLRG